MTTTDKERPPLPAHAQRLWAQLQSNLLDFNKTLIEIIETESWKPTYGTFTEAWEDKMYNIDFGRQMLPHIAYQMFNEGRTPDQVADVVPSIGPETAKRLKEQQDSGVPAYGADIVVRRHNRKPAGPWNWLRLKVGHDTNVEWRRIAKKHDKTVEAIVMQAATAAFKKLATQ
jgi:hypothetical protein